MKAEEIRDMSLRELRLRLEESHQELFNLRFQIATRKIKNHQRIPAVKRDIARIKTALRERELMAMYGGVEMEEDDTETGMVAAQQAPRRQGLLGRIRRGGSR
jgi:large subunit ribosomal protein L29